MGSDQGVPFTAPSRASIYSTADGTLLQTYRGTYTLDLFGGGVAFLGDLDGDGLDDVGVGSDNYSVTQLRTGAVTVFRGSDCAQLRPYCVSTPNSHFNQRAGLVGVGSMQLADAELELLVVDAPVGEFGVFLAGSQPALVSSGDGFLCIGGALTRLGVVQIGVTGLAVLDLASTFPNFAPGQTVYFQFAFRDPQGPGGGGLQLLRRCCWNVLPLIT